MQEKILIKRSPAGLQVQIVLIGVVALVLAFLSTWMIVKLLPSNNYRVIINAVIWLLFALAWLIGSFKLWFDWHIKRYEIASDALIIHAKAGKLGKAQTVYRYESMISVRTTQNLLGRQFGYGDVFITIPKLDAEVVMNDIENPFEQLSEIQRRIDERAAGSHALVS